MIFVAHTNKGTIIEHITEQTKLVDVLIKHNSIKLSSVITYTGSKQSIIVNTIAEMFIKPSNGLYQLTPAQVCYLEDRLLNSPR
jgi:hypothetical protein